MTSFEALEIWNVKISSSSHDNNEIQFRIYTITFLAIVPTRAELTAYRLGLFLYISKLPYFTFNMKCNTVILNG